MIHDTAEDVSEVRELSGSQLEAVALLELTAPGRRSVRLTLAQWRHVDRVVVALAIRDAVARDLAIQRTVPSPRDPEPSSI
jgi:hypothetical protein